MNVLLITDAWDPQVNGVVRTYQNTIKQLKKMGHDVKVIHPYLPEFKRVELPGYPEIEIVTNPWKMDRHLRAYTHHHIHIATEGPLGLYARIALRKRKFTTCYHTQFPEFIEARTHIPAQLFYPFFRWFHNKAVTTFVPTQSMADFLAQRGFTQSQIWTRGVDATIFNPERRNKNNNEPYILCVSRISHEKGIDDFCKLSYPRKVVIGDGPYLSKIKAKYPDVEFIGPKYGVELATWYANAEVFVFPSKADTFGIVILEALACGTPVAAYWQPGPIETIELSYNGMMSDNLEHAVKVCHDLVNRNDVYESSKRWTWEASTASFLKHLH